MISVVILTPYILQSVEFLFYCSKANICKGCWILHILKKTTLGTMQKQNRYRTLLIYKKRRKEQGDGNKSINKNITLVSLNVTATTKI